jgi:glycosyltransferase involved in cell wall biosynthesis
MLLGRDASRASAAERTGTEAYATFLIRELVRQTADTPHRLRLYFNQPPPVGLLEMEEAPHVEQVIIPLPRLWTHVRLGWELQQRPPDWFFTPAHVIPLTYFGPSMATVHDVGYEHFPEAHPTAQRLYLRWSTRHNGRRARLVLADSHATKRDLAHWYAIPPEKIHVVYPGLDPALAEGAGRPLSFPLPRPYLLFLSTLQPRKNVARLVEAFAQVCAAIPHQLVLAGRMGWQSQQIEAVLAGQSAAVQSRITRLGYVAEADKAPLIAGADALLYPSLYEGFGFPLLEGNLCGTPVLASNTSSLPELAGDGAALLVNPQDRAALGRAIRQIVEDEPLRQRLIANGRQNGQRFTWAKAATAVLALLDGERA